MNEEKEPTPAEREVWAAKDVVKQLKSELKEAEDSLKSAWAKVNKERNLP